MKKISILLLVIVAALASCKKVPEVNLKYVDVERDLITVGTTTATIQCDYEYIATLKKAFLYYCEGTDTINMSIAEMSVVQKTLYVELSGLKENTTYSYYYEFANGFNSMRSATRTFKTEGSGTTITMPTVVTAEVTEITSTAAKSGGEVTNDGGAEVTERGICWSTNANPTLNGSHNASGTGIGAFTAMMNGLEANTTYHVRAYATNEKGTAYGLDREFVTVGGGGSGTPEGAVNGLFTINANGDQVYFSQGNLQYQASTNTWRFAEHQWDYVGGTVGGVEYGNVYENGIKCNNALISQTYSGWIDLFGWGTSGYNHGAICYQPWSISSNCLDYYAYNDCYGNLSDYTGQADWGFNRIINGGNADNQWRSLTVEEWEFIINQRNTNTNIRYAKAVVNNLNGLILIPDDWNSDSFDLNDINTSNSDYESNVFTTSEWTMLENLGVVFLPCSGYRIAPTMYENDNVYGSCWSASYKDNYHSYFFGYWDAKVQADTYITRANGLTVRMVHDKQ